MNDHEMYMQRCLQLARLGAGTVAPNPMVGAVLVHEGRIIGEGYHRQYGEAHAEVNCIGNVLPADRELVAKSTMYVSLEPCNHFGKTPPCADLVIEHKIPHVVIGCRDSFAKVNGSGVRKLMDAGIRVTEGVLEEEAMELNKRFFTFHQQQRPYIILKWAQSDNGMIAGKGPGRTHISNDITNRLAHRWRAEEAAILVGTNTARADDPSLTTRLWPGNNPVRVVIDRQLSLPATQKIFSNDAPTIIINTQKQEESDSNLFYKIGEEENVPAVIVNILRQRQLTSLIVEGGAILLQSFIDAGLWDEARVITNTGLDIPEGIAAPLLKEHRLVSAQTMLTDRVQYFTHLQSTAAAVQG